jgi:ferredoxin
MEAIVIDEVAHVDLDRCIGCGLCIPSCDAEAIHLAAKDEDDQWMPPATVIGTYTNIAKERGKL